jgi:hypothetical protein
MIATDKQGFYLILPKHQRRRKRTFYTSGSSSTSSSKNGVQPLCQWSEIVGHPGLVTAFLQSSNNPVILMVKPEQISAQVIFLEIFSA